jgi:hypothetical protein
MIEDFTRPMTTGYTEDTWTHQAHPIFFDDSGAIFETTTVNRIAGGSTAWTSPSSR